MKITTWAIRKWDWAIYRLAYGTIRRMCQRDPVFTIILDRSIQEWRIKSKMEGRLDKSDDLFFDIARRSYADKK